MADQGSQRHGRVVVVGSINSDWVVRCAAIPRPGQTVHGRELVEIPGGKGANQAVAAARLGAQDDLVGRLGDDAFGHKLRQHLSREGVGLTHVRPTADLPSGLAIIHVDDAGENAITVIAGANGRVDAADVDAAAALIANAAVVMLQLEIPIDAVLRTIEVARSFGTPVMLDPAPAPVGYPVGLLDVDWICPNESEAEALTGIAVDSDQSAVVVARRLCELGAKCALLTRGPRGVVMANADGRVESFPAPNVDAIDSTAAGDAFAGAFAARLALGDSVVSAIRYGVCAGACAVTVRGAQTSLPRPVDVAALMARSLKG